MYENLWYHESRGTCVCQTHGFLQTSWPLLVFLHGHSHRLSASNPQTHGGFVNRYFRSSMIFTEYKPVNVKCHPTVFVKHHKAYCDG